MIIVNIEEVVSSSTIVDFVSRCFYLNRGWNCMAIMQDFHGFCQLS
jgi:hypothetical protein